MFVVVVFDVVVVVVVVDIVVSVVVVFCHFTPLAAFWPRSVVLRVPFRAKS